MSFRKIHTRYLKRTQDGTKPWWFQNGRVDLFLWTRPDGSLDTLQCAHQEVHPSREVYADWTRDGGARIGFVEGSAERAANRAMSPTIDFGVRVPPGEARHLLDAAAECLPEIPEPLRMEVNRALGAVRGLFGGTGKSESRRRKEEPR
ncbi:MAG: hypothetical protein HYY93_01345 [Planctomycetes bacterium]|nr:hypothetical protein [Planctomycetota bacterium]